MKTTSPSISLLIFFIIAANSNAEQCRYSIEHIQLGYSLDRVKTINVGWEYHGLHTTGQGMPVATYSKLISDIQMNGGSCVCSWHKETSLYLDKSRNVSGIDLLITNTMGRKEVEATCSQNDKKNCIESGNFIFDAYLADFMSKHGDAAVNETKNAIKFIWKDNGCTLLLWWSPFNSIVSLRKDPL